MTQQRWLRIIPVALIMYTISYVDRTNVSLALDPKISNMMRDLLMDDRMKGEAGRDFLFRLRFAPDPKRLSGFTLERQEGHQPVPRLLGSLRRGLRIVTNVPAVRSDAIFPGRGRKRSFSCNDSAAG
jgi:hypothetical protein